MEETASRRTPGNPWTAADVGLARRLLSAARIPVELLQHEEDIDEGLGTS
jgi:hypothetical protein